MGRHLAKRLPKNAKSHSGALKPIKLTEVNYSHLKAMRDLANLKHSWKYSLKFIVLYH